MRKGTTNTKLHDSYDIMRAYSKLYNAVMNDQLDQSKASLLLSILNGVSTHYKSCQLEDECNELREIVEDINKAM